MTYEELDALPETDSAMFTYIEKIIDGKRVQFPVIPNAGPMWREPADPFGAVDKSGVYWEIGRIDGVLVKRRAPVPLCMLCMR